MKTLFVVSLTLAALTALSRPLIASYTCEIVSVPDASVGLLYGVNNRGQVVMTTQGADNTVKSFRRDRDGSLTEILVPGSFETDPQGINDSGQIAGSYQDSDGFFHAFIRETNGNYLLIDPPEPDHMSHVGGLNNLGDIAGNLDSGPFIRLSSGEFIKFARPPAASIWGINDQGSVIETLGDVTGSTTSTVRRIDGTRIPIIVPGFEKGAVVVQGINNNDEVVGRVWDFNRNNPIIPFIHKLGTRYFPLLSCPGEPSAPFEPRGISSNGLIVGEFETVAKFIATPSGDDPTADLSDQQWTFAAHAPGDGGAQGKIYLTNNGSVALNIGYIRLTGDTASLGYASSCGAKLDTSKTCALTINFDPVSTGPHKAQLYIYDDAPDAPQVIRIDGVGAGPAARISDLSWHFAPHPVGDSSGPGTVYIYNQGTAPLRFSSITIAGKNASDFSIVQDTCGTVLDAYKTCRVTFKFTPTAVGPRQASLLVHTNAIPPSQTVSLTGFSPGAH